MLHSLAWGGPSPRPQEGTGNEKLDIPGCRINFQNFIEKQFKGNLRVKSSVFQVIQPSKM